eukprot:1008294-Prymnesium_polylepis.1
MLLRMRRTPPYAAPSADRGDADLRRAHAARDAQARRVVAARRRQAGWLHPSRPSATPARTGNHVTRGSWDQPQHHLGGKGGHVPGKRGDQHGTEKNLELLTSLTAVRLSKSAAVEASVYPPFEIVMRAGDPVTTFVTCRSACLRSRLDVACKVHIE